MTDSAASSSSDPLMNRGEIVIDPNRTDEHPPGQPPQCTLSLKSTWARDPNLRRPSQPIKTLAKTHAKRKKKTPSKLKMTPSSDEDAIKPSGSGSGSG